MDLDFEPCNNFLRRLDVHSHLSYGEDFWGYVKLMRDQRTELFSRYLPEDWSIDDELALFAVQSADKQQAVEQRLRAIDSYLDGTSQDGEGVDAASATLGVGRRQFFKLLAKLRQFGPTRGLTPGFRNVERRSVASDGLEEPLETVIREILARNPAERISRLEAAIRAKCDETEIPFPGESAIRRRVHALRRLPPTKKVSATVGTQITTDQVHLDLTVKIGSDDRYAIVTLIIDDQTKLILGHGLMGGYGEGEGLRLAIDDFEDRIPDFAKASLGVAPHLQEVTVIIPRDLEFASHSVGSDTFAIEKPIVKVMDTGPRRHGAAILRHIGDRLPPFSFKPMAMERFGAASPHNGMPLDAARRLVRGSVERWNEGILSQAVEATGQRTTRQNRLKRIARDLRTLTDPLYELVEDVRGMFDEARAK